MAEPRGAVHRGAEVLEIESFEARDGDSLVVSYPEVTLPLPRKFATMKFGGLIYTRKLVAGESVLEQYRLVSAFMRKVAESDGAAKYRRLVAEFDKEG